MLSKKELSKYILGLRPNLSPSTVKSYTSFLFQIYFQATNNKDIIDTEWFSNNQHKIIEILKSRPHTSINAMLTPVCVLINDPEKTSFLRTEMLKNAIEYNKSASSGVKTETQEENWIPYDEVVEKWNEWKIKADDIIKLPDYMQTEHVKIDFKKFILLSLTSGIYFPPRRSEWVSMKFKNYDPEKDNYIDFENKLFIINKYKTSRFYGQSRIPIPDQLLYYMQKFIEIVKPPTEYLFTSSRGEPFINSRLTDILNSIFGKKVSVTMLRHIYKSHKYPNIPPLTQLRDDAKQMGHSLVESLQYIKR